VIEDHAALTTLVRIYDTFLFDGELDLLEHRLRQNFEAVDVFVLIEAAETYRGRPKPLVFEQHRSRFAWAAHKIRAIQLRSLGPSDASPRERAAVQRNALVMALYDAVSTDVILLEDADEIPSPAILAELRANGLEEPYRLEMTRHYQSVNLLAPASTCCIDRQQPFAFAANHPRPQRWEPGTLWSGQSAIALPASSLQGSSGLTPFAWRFQAVVDRVIPASGRHLTAVDPAAQLLRKMTRVFHEEWATERGLYPAHLARCEQHAVHHRGWWYAEAVPGDLPADLAQLGRACPATMRWEPIPAMWRRRCVRTWSWARQSRALPDALVKHIDDRFDSLLPWIAAPLLLLDGVRYLAAGMMRSPRRSRGQRGT
jgi:beta-1,4-mannosyl-glycoprotein beta-1,4-N-acetylglucosaminyltransferase